MQNNKIFNFCNFYILLWLVYDLQGILFGGRGGGLSTIIIYMLIGVSAYHFMYALFHYNMPKYMKGLTALVFMFTIYGAILVISGQTIRFSRTGTLVKNYNYIKTIYISLLPIYSFYVFTRKGLLTKDILLKWTFVFFVAAVMQFFRHQREMLISIEDAEEITNNYGYAFLSMIPLLVFWEHKRFVQYLGLGFSMLFIILGMKRGAILIGALCVVWFLLYSMKTASRRQKIWVVLLSIIIIIVGYYVVSYMIQSSAYFNSRIENTLEGNSSGRDSLYGIFWQHFINESNPLRFLFGNGANATLKITWNYAHNDWLEIAINQGLLGIVVYLVYWIEFYKTWRKSKVDNQLFLAIGLVLLIFFLKTIFSMSYGAMSVYVTICLGYCMGMLSEYDNQTSMQNEQN